MTSPLLRPDRDTTLMATAHVFADRSTCSRGHVGAVIAREGRIIQTGYNGAPAGMPHCSHVCNCPAPKDMTVAADRLGIHRDGCPADSPCRTAVHAEVNAIAFAARHGVAVDGADLYVTMAPCLGCAQVIINAGVARVVFDQPYRDRAGLRLLMDAGVTVDRLT
jgi:dCMP deaminase